MRCLPIAGGLGVDLRQFGDGGEVADPANLARADRELVQDTFRVLAILLKEDGAWRIVQTQWSHAGPIR